MFIRARAGLQAAGMVKSLINNTTRSARYLTAVEGSNSVQTEVEFDAAALITIEGDFNADPPEIDVSKVELIEGIDSVDFGEVEMDHGDDPYDDQE